ncbi:MAG: PspA/IM30 family protein [Gammaproteobacteria bacterium]
MALINRLTRLFRADMHAVLDRIEEPDVLLKQAIREMEEALSHNEQQLKILNHEMGQLTARRDELEQSLADLEQELDICFESAQDDLAKALIKRKLEAERFRKFLARKRDTLQNSLTELNERVEQNRRQLDGMRQKAEVLAEDVTPRDQDYHWNAPDFTVREEDVAVAFLREQQKRSRL